MEHVQYGSLIIVCVSLKMEFVIHVQTKDSRLNAHIVAVVSFGGGDREIWHVLTLKYGYFVCQKYGQVYCSQKIQVYCSQKNLQVKQYF